MADEREMSRAVDFLYEVGLLKRYKRTGWLVAGVPAPESIADHSHRAAVAAAVIASVEGADPQRAAFLSLLHDSQESRTTDIPHVGKRYVSTASHEEVTAAQTAGLPSALAALVAGAVAEYEADVTPEAQCARDADKVECLLQAVEYREQGTDTQAWIDTSLAALRTATAKRIADTALRTGSLEWMHRARTGGGAG
ncbi:HD domain-containing protein [Allonocardiopsis opalescens]|uniref:Putative hydrolase of HD superfamily n=1 Tax=Allonocardiopsis opalescens TaxID=1144618 RepID=A0A2T0Q7K2_9ACTN|nr:HD domain-containing protein [Allonocardiopsis opalescens]PRX99807.1 putative hydrolase of HD superfamily [Allonocardiopsis opalescens]